MPPETAEVAPPESLGFDAIRWLEAHGVNARIAPIGSSDFELCLHNPRLYYWTRRIGVMIPLRYSKALNRGSWFHARAEFFDYDFAEARRHVLARLEARKAELKEVCQSLGKKPVFTAITLDREEKDCLTAISWFEASATLPVIDGKSVLELLQAGHFRILGRELELSYEHPHFSKTRLRTAADILLYHEGQNNIWAIDWKTTSARPAVRLAICPNEFQTQHSLHILQWLIDDGVLQKEYDLPDNVTIGGMIHWAFLKPTIKLCGKDRPFHWASEGKGKGVRGRVDQEDGKWKTATGPLEGALENASEFATFEEALTDLHKQTGKKPEKVHYGEPSVDYFIARCKEWLTATGEYDTPELVKERGAFPAVGRSITGGRTLLDNNWTEEYLSRLSLVYGYATCPACPNHFPASASGLIGRDQELHPLARLFTYDATRWPDTIRKANFLVGQFRD